MDDRIQQIVDFLHGAWRARVRVAELARRFGVCASRLEHLFKRDMNMSIRDFIRERRLAEAARLLASTDQRVTTISFEAGFPDLSYFNRLFKRRFGVPPLRYRMTVRCDQRRTNLPSVALTSGTPSANATAK